ncbi:MAG: dipeptide/oligopeptide/nickel ABC transporter ATP-binding protein [Oscillospiraceae bacterium]|jgi:peptide/nickel transport system ATP-binding protein|nr:dipeptide/oligopeptide/nickel ABC transporter ATP-binding protein [Oscillospiraceae bacterium]
MLEITNLTKSFRRAGAKAAETPLNGAEMRIERAEIVALTGKSGEGKSTIARLLCGTLRADAGRVTLNGEFLLDGKRYNRDIGRVIGLVPQQPYAALDPRQRLGDAVAEPLLARRLVSSRTEAKTRAAQLFAEVSLGAELLDRLPSQVSGGQAQRAAIARVLGTEPKLLIADEATSMLDPAAQAVIINVLKSLVLTRGISVLLISHDPELVDNTADRVYALSGGKINIE